MPLHPYISSLFTPTSIAVLGASHSQQKIGNIVIQNLLEARFSGKIFPVNPKGGTICGLSVLSKLEDVPATDKPLSLAVICLPAHLVVNAMQTVAKAEIKAAIILAAGFKEIGGIGATYEEEVKKIAQQHEIALLGPNSLGLINKSACLNATFATGQPLTGNIGFFSQSGALCVATFDWARQQNIGFSSFISLGNKAILDESDVLAYLAEDPATKVILGYLESVESGPRFLENAHLATRKKPVILLKAGKTDGGARAASSHTGALAGSDMAYDAAFRQTGIIRAQTVEDLFSMAQAFASQPLPAGSGLGIVTNAGGPGIIATDACELAGLTLARLAPTTIEALKSTLPPYAALYNPVDVVSDAPSERIVRTIETMLADPAVHSLLILLVPTAHEPITQIVTRCCEAVKGTEKTVFACLMGGEEANASRTVFSLNGIPCYSFPEPAIDAIATMFRQSQWKENPLPVEISYRHDHSRAQAVIQQARENSTLELVEYQAQELAYAYELPVLESKLARSSDEAVQIAKQIGTSVALKIASPQISHKSDVHGVALDLHSTADIRAAFLDITTRAKRMRPESYIAGCLVQKMAPKNAREVIIGFKRDVRFGPMLIFGLGGIHVEIFKDIACRLAPLSLNDAHDMIREIKAFPILAGIRGQQPVKFTAIEDIILIMTQLALDFPEIQEAECNPVLVTEEGATIADIRILLAPQKVSRSETDER